jgi:D-alanyl-D-alanine endopeptidase (penicillin-binding protein 7)
MKKSMIAVLLLLAAVPGLCRETSLWVYNTTLEQIVLSETPDTTRAIASISKLMTAMVSLDYDSNIYAKIPMVNKRKTKWTSRKHMMAAMLIRSDNQAAEAIAADYPGGRTAFMAAMNRKARDLGLVFTNFNDPSGLSHGNVSIAAEVGRMVRAASRYTVIRELSHQKQMLIEAKHKKKVRKVMIQNTNTKILMEFDIIEVSKTGFTSAAGYCVAMLAKTRSQEFVIVVLGEPDKHYRKRTVESIMRNHVLDSEL